MLLFVGVLFLLGLEEAYRKQVFNMGLAAVTLLFIKHGTPGTISCGGVIGVGSYLLVNSSFATSPTSATRYYAEPLAQK